MWARGGITDSKWGRRIGTACSYAWGGVGAACNVVYASAYAAQGRWGQAALQFVPGGAGKIISRAVYKTVGKGVNQRIWGRARVNRYKHRTIKWASRNGYTVRGVRKLGKDFRDVASYSARRRAVTYVGRRISAAAGGIGSYYLGTRI